METVAVSHERRLHVYKILLNGDRVDGGSGGHTNQKVRQTQRNKKSEKAHRETVVAAAGAELKPEHCLLVEKSRRRFSFQASFLSFFSKQTQINFKHGLDPNLKSIDF